MSGGISVKLKPLIVPMSQPSGARSSLRDPTK
jgi:hypothetical protein